MTCTSDFSPAFQAQSPAVSGYRYGWSSCAAFVGAMAHDYAACGNPHYTGAQVRNQTNEPIPDPASPGLTITQVANALAKLGTPVTTFARLAWSDVEHLIDTGHYVSLCGKYSVIRPTAFSGDPNFYGNHQIGIPPGWEAQDPLCDGRRAGIYKYQHEAYPRDLLRRFAGAFVVTYRHPDGSTYGAPIGLGYAQGFYTVAHPAPAASHTLLIAAGTTSILTANLSGSCIASWTKRTWSGIASSAPCLAPEYRKGCSSGGATVAPVTAGVFAGQRVRIGNGVSVT